MSDSELLQAFVERRDEDAFRRLVERYVGVVYGAARRQVHDAHLAEDVTQAVFVMLAAKAPSIDPRVLGGWLVKAARYAAQASARSEIRRKQREQRAAMMRSESAQEESAAAVIDAPEAHLDEGLSRLGEKDRTAITLRYLQNKPVREVAAAMGVSEDAASKRLSRAVAKLREFLARRRGSQVTPMILVGMLGEQARIVAPQGLAAAATQAGLSGAAGGSVALIAKNALAIMSWKLIGLAATVMIVFATAIGAALVGNHLMNKPAVAREVQVGEPSLAPAAATTRPVRVGVYLSFQTATGAGPSGATRGWNAQVHNLKDIKGGEGLELVPLVEPGTADKDEVARRLRFHFRGAEPMNVTDAAALRKLDVIVVNAVCHPMPEALEAVEAAVTEGTGLVVRQCFGGCDPGYQDARVARLRGLARGQQASVREGNQVECEVVAAHPLLGSLAAVGKTVTLRATGGFGEFADGAVPLIRVKSMENMGEPHGRAYREDTRRDFYPLYVARLGKGRIVSCSFGNWIDTPVELQEATGGKFTQRAVLWAAGREIP